MLRGAAGVEADASREGGTCQRARRDERTRGDKSPAVVDANNAEPLPFAYRQRHGGGSGDARDERPADAHGAPNAGCSYELQRLATVTGLRERVRRSLLDHARDTVSGKTPPEQRREIAVALLARGAAENGRVNRVAGPAHSGDLAPSGGTGVSGLDADHARKRRQQVVPRVEDAAARDRVAAQAYEFANRPVAHGNPREACHIRGARVLARRVEPVGPNETCVPQAKLVGLHVHPPNESGDVAPARIRSERVGSVVRALDQRGLDEIAHGDVLAGA